VKQRDIHGHGTNVAGIAAGDGSATGNGGKAGLFTGVAPEADLVIVKAGDGSFPDDNVIEGVRYIIERARDLEKPCVINLSFGSQVGAHDGTSIMEAEITKLAGQGKIFVVAAGNEGNDPVHIEGSFSSSVKDNSFKFQVPSYMPQSGNQNDVVVVDIWLEQSSDLSAKLVTPFGENIGRVDEGEADQVSTDAGIITYYIAKEGPDPRNGAKEIYFYITDEHEDKPPSQGTWELTISGNTGYFDGWLSSSMDSYFTEGSITYSMLLGYPSNAQGCITVGAYVTKNYWFDMNGTLQNTGIIVGDIRSYSSPGPTRDGRNKPEITGPGALITTSRSADSRHSTSTYTYSDGVHETGEGTSFAAPVVAGLAALLLEKDPTLTPGLIAALLSENAFQDAFTGNTWNAKWGYGKLDGLRTFEAVQDFMEIEIWADKVVNFSSEFSLSEGSAQQILGQPDTYPNYGNYSTAWSPSSESGSKEYIEVGFEKALLLTKLSVYETYNPGAIDTIYARDSDGYTHLLWGGTAAPAGTSARILEISVPMTSYLVDKIILHLKPELVPGKNEIDAVKMTGYEGMGGGDIFPPLITEGVKIRNVTSSSVEITWQTDEPATSEIVYGLTVSYSDTVVDSSLTKFHLVRLSGLQSGESYYFKAGSRDEEGNGPTFSDEMVFSTADIYGNLWEISNTDFNRIMTAVTFVSDSSGWVAGGNGFVAATKDEGKSWQSSITNANIQLNGIFFIDKNIGCVCGDYGYVYYTTDGGVQWHQAAKVTDKNLYAVHFINSTTGWVSGADGILLKSTDGGVSWNTHYSGVIKHLFDVTFINESKGFCVGKDGMILKTENGGTTWSQVTIRNTYDLKEVFFIDEANGWIVGRNGTIYLTSNGGDNWETTIFIGEFSEDINTVFFVNPDTGWFGGNYGTIYGTMDGGTSWKQQKSGASKAVRDMFFTGNARGWGVTDAGKLLRYTNTNLYTGIAKDYEYIQPKTFELLHNYPNPFNAETVISFKLNKHTTIVLTVYNILGQHVRTLLDKDMSSGFHKITWDGKNAAGNSVSSGLYLYELRTEETREVKKMLMVR